MFSEFTSKAYCISNIMLLCVDDEIINNKGIDILSIILYVTILYFLVTCVMCIYVNCKCMFLTMQFIDDVMCAYNAYIL